jgi:hypothetical protein
MILSPLCWPCSARWSRGVKVTGWAAPPPASAAIHLSTFFSRAIGLSPSSNCRGVDKSGLQIEAKEKTIRISGTKAVSYDGKVSVHRRERLSGIFDRTISLPLQIDANGIRAEYRDGVLTLFIPSAASERSHTIKIN